jgi:hypothetical protein
MGAALSRPLPYSCYEVLRPARTQVTVQVAHTWTPHCSAGALDVGLACVRQGLGMYSTIYLVLKKCKLCSALHCSAQLAELVKGRVPGRRELLQLVGWERL